MVDLTTKKFAKYLSTLKATFCYLVAFRLRYQYYTNDEIGQQQLDRDCVSRKTRGELRGYPNDHLVVSKSLGPGLTSQWEHSDAHSGLL